MVAFKESASLEAIFIKFCCICGNDMGANSSINGIYITSGLFMNITAIIIQVFGKDIPPRPYDVPLDHIA